MTLRRTAGEASSGGSSRGGGGGEARPPPAEKPEVDARGGVAKLGCDGAATTLLRLGLGLGLGLG